MQELDDQALLREYAERNSGTAFAEIVARHVDKVYSVALRHTRNPHQAEEITQAVFVILAQKARKLGGKVILSGWLYQTARLTALTLLRSEIRRARREQEAYMQSTLDESDPARTGAAEAEAWPHIAPLLDDALSGLGEKDRHAVVLRFFDGLSLKQVGAALGSSEDAAKARVSRALEKLRKFFGRKGVPLSVGAIAAAVSTHSVHAAPAGLAVKISAVGGGATTTTILAKETMNAMTWSSMRTMIAVGAAILLAAGTTALLTQQPGKPVAQIPYKVLEDAWLFQESINPTNLTFHFLIVSKNKGVHPQDIHLTIDSSSQGKMAVRLGDRGQVLNCPCDDDLRRENPFVVSDQPKGSLAPGYWVYVPRPAGTTFRYRQLANAVEEANKAAARAKQMAEQDFGGNFPMFPGAINAVGLHFPQARAGKAKVTIASSAGVKEYVADSQGIIKLKINPSLQAENPELVFSERPDWIGIGHM